jgi:hypothetical protein
LLVPLSAGGHDFIVRNINPKPHIYLTDCRYSSERARHEKLNGLETLMRKLSRMVSKVALSHERVSAFGAR